MNFPKESESPWLVFSSLLYCAFGIFLFTKQFSSIPGDLLTFTGAAAFAHHLYPNNLMFRISDWLGSIIIILFLLFHFTVTPLYLIFSLAILFIWLYSFYSFHKTHNIHHYTIAHSIWHILSAILVFLII